MRMINTATKQSVRVLQLYLTVEEAREFQEQLGHLLADPEANEHFHFPSADTSREISCSLLTPRKLAELPYADAERREFEEK
jgi:hypothetical protein